MGILSWILLPISPFLSFVTHFKAAGFGWLSSIFGGILVQIAVYATVFYGFQMFVNSWWPNG